MAAFLKDPFRKCGAILPALDAVGLSTTQNVRDLFVLDDPDEVDDVMQELIAEVCLFSLRKSLSLRFVCSRYTRAYRRGLRVGRYTRAYRRGLRVVRYAEAQCRGF